jgi:hypothetical protein
LRPIAHGYHRTLDRSFSIQQALVKRAAKEDKKKVEKPTPARARKRA